jgi:hypothetical protein
LDDEQAVQTANNSATRAENSPEVKNHRKRFGITSERSSYVDAEGLTASPESPDRIVMQNALPALTARRIEDCQVEQKPKSIPPNYTKHTNSSLQARAGFDNSTSQKLGVNTIYFLDPGLKHQAPTQASPINIENYMESKPDVTSFIVGGQSCKQHDRTPTLRIKAVIQNG